MRKNTNILLIVACVFAGIAPVNVLAQEKIDTLVTLPLGKKDDSVFAFGSIHGNGENKAYSDTALANSFFRELAKRVDPNKVVLVVELPSSRAEGGDKEIRTDQCPWITPEMRQMGFTKYIPADTRPGNAKTIEKGWKAMEEVEEIMRDFFDVYKLDSLDNFELPILLIRENMIIAIEAPNYPDDFLGPEELFFVPEFRAFEANLLRVSDSLKKEGYVPVIAAGALHVLALGRPCAIQVERQPSDVYHAKKTEEQEIIDKLAYSMLRIKAHNMFWEKYAQ